MRPPLLPVTLALAAALTACSPSLDWRELQAEGSGVVALFPCKPDRHARTLSLAGQTVRMEMLVCSAAGSTFALSFADLNDPARVAAVLSELRALAVSNIGATRHESAALQVPGMTPNAQALRITIEGLRPDGGKVQEHAAFFAKGLRVYQATVLGARVPLESADTFVGGLKLPS